MAAVLLFVLFQLAESLGYLCVQVIEFNGVDDKTLAPFLLHASNASGLVLLIQMVPSVTKHADTLTGCMRAANKIRKKDPTPRDSNHPVKGTKAKRSPNARFGLRVVTFETTASPR